MKRKCFKKEQLHDRYLHIPCTTEVKRKGQCLFKHKSNSSGIFNNLHNTLCQFQNPIMSLDLFWNGPQPKQREVCKVHGKVASIQWDTSAVINLFTIAFHPITAQRKYGTYMTYKALMNHMSRLHALDSFS